MAGGISGIQAIVGCTDRMVTQGDIQFEVPGLSPNRPDAPIFKSVPMNRHIIVMTAGDAGFQTQALQHLWEATEASRKNTTGGWSEHSVRDVAVTYQDFCNAKRREATDTLLAPYGLSAQSFINKQQNLSDQFVRWVLNEVEDARNNIGDSIIVCGIDATGAHIYLCTGDILAPADSIGFAAIGSGGKHARSQFILGNHSRFDRLEHTILLAYAAKRRSEKAPGVGELTDMFVIPYTGRYFLTHPQLQELERIYQRMETSQTAAFKKGQASAIRYVARLMATEKAAAATAEVVKELSDQSSPTTSSSDQT